MEEALNKQLDTKTSIVRLGAKVGVTMPSISTGLPSFDWNVSQIGGIPRPRITEVFGPESSGKTTFALNAIKEEQGRGNICAIVDVEHALDPGYAAKLGVDVDNLLVSQPDCGEDALEITEALVKSQAVSLIVIDSVAALVPRAELEGEMGAAHMGLQARLLSQACRKLRGICSMCNVPIIFINQIRLNLGGYGNPEVTTGGRALKFYASLRLDIRRVPGDEGKIMESGEQVGQRTRIRAVKNKIGSPFKETVVDLYYGVGYDKEADWVEYAASLGVIKRAGAWYSFGDARFQGFPKIKDALTGDPKLMDALKQAVDKARKEAECTTTQTT